MTKTGNIQVLTKTDVRHLTQEKGRHLHQNSVLFSEPARHKSRDENSRSVPASHLGGILVICVVILNQKLLELVFAVTVNSSLTNVKCLDH